ncbi:hypothetical protein EV183_005591 [Coemansia sp. RSA 2336]|nr:hypothetical protein EV183_005591 [Coemansia sp. RSA 2336]
MDSSNGESAYSSHAPNEYKEPEQPNETGSEPSYAGDSNSDSDYDPQRGIKLTTYNYHVNANDFMNLPYDIPIFHGYSYEITSAFLDLVEQSWSPYQYLQSHWVTKVHQYLADEARKVADDFVGFDWQMFRTHMEKWFPSSMARMQKRYMMVDAREYLVDLDMRQAVAQAQRDYDAQGPGYDAPEPAGILAKRVPSFIQAKYNFTLYSHLSGREILKILEDIVWKERVELGSDADWLKPLKSDKLVARSTKQPASVAACSSQPPASMSSNTRIHSLHWSSQPVASGSNKSYYDYLNKMIK